MNRFTENWFTENYCSQERYILARQYPHPPRFMCLYSTEINFPVPPNRSHKTFRKFGLSDRSLISDDWLALSIGNSRLHWAWFSEDVLQASWDTAHLDAFGIQHLIINQFNFHRCQLIDPSIPLPQWESIPELWIISVVPHQTQFWQQYLRSNLLTLSDIPLGDAYPTLGADRAIAAWEAVQLARGAALVIDCGTALTLTGANAEGCLVGGAILPGLRLQLQSLGQSTAALPTLVPENIQTPTRWAMNTAESISSGVLYSIVSSVNSFIEDWQTRFPSSPIYITGGDTIFISDLIRQYLPHLTSQLCPEKDLAFLGMSTLRQYQIQHRSPSCVQL
jgi:type III pantothenate kinase